MTHIYFTDSCSRSTPLSTCPNIVSREGWGARAATQPLTRLSDTPSHVYVHHGTGRACNTNEECQEILRSYQNYHMDDRGNGYQFGLTSSFNLFIVIYLAYIVPLHVSLYSMYSMLHKLTKCQYNDYLVTY